MSLAIYPGKEPQAIYQFEHDDLMKLIKMHRQDAARAMQEEAAREAERMAETDWHFALLANTIRKLEVES